MPTLQFSRALELNAAPATVWNAITDVARLVEWISIAHSATEIARLEHYSAILQDRLGPFKLRADLDIHITEVIDGQLLVGQARGEDHQIGAQISVDALVRLAENGGSTTLAIEGTYTVAGRIATLGTSMIHSKAQKILDEFFDRVREEFD